jgi:restriction endonuclease S subunit
MSQITDNLALFVEGDNKLSLLKELIVNAAAKGSFGINYDIASGSFKYEDLNPSNWTVSTIQEVAEFTNGYAFKSSDFVDDGVGIVRMSDLKNNEISVDKMKYVSKDFLSNLSPAFQVKPNDLVIGMSGSIGRPCFNRTNQIFLLNQRVGKISPDLNLVTPEFLAISLASLEQYFLQISMGSAIKNLSTSQIKQTKITIPPLEIQKFIVEKYNEFSILVESLMTSKSDEKLLVTKFRNSAVDAISKAQTPEETQIAWERIQNNWEVLTETSDSVESIKLLIHDLATQGVLSGEEIFEVVNLKDIAQINYGYTESANSAEIGPKFLRITDIQMGKVNWDSVPYCSISSADEEKHLLQGGDLVFARTGATTGKSYLLNNPPRSVCASYLIRVRPDAEKVLPEYLYLYFQSGQYWADVDSGISGTAQGGFNSTKLGALAIRIPDRATQAEIVKKTNELLQVCEDLGNSLLRRQILAERYSRSVVSISA